jgi:hypothetical protein
VYTPTYSTVYSTGDLLLGIPSNWVHTTFSKYVYYNWHGTVAERAIDLCSIRILDDVIGISTHERVWTGGMVEVVRGSPEEQMEYIFDPVELQAVFPTLVTVYDTCDGGEPKYAINYAGMTPILTKAINEQQEVIVTLQETINQLPQVGIGALQDMVNNHQILINQQQEINNQQQMEIEMLKRIVFGHEIDLTELYELRDRVNVLQEIVSKCCGIDIPFMKQQQDSLSNSRNSNIPNEAVLYQTKPSSFSTNTDISCYVPIILDSAFIFVYNLQGMELKSFPLTQGLNIVTILASELPAGMYLYTLVVDDEIIESKRIILTK